MREWLKMKVKITGFSFSSAWYKNRIGEVFEVYIPFHSHNILVHINKEERRIGYVMSGDYEETI